MEVLKKSGWVEVFRVGTWNGQFYGKDYLQKMKENFDKGVAKVSAIIGHTTFFGPELPALAWASDVRVRGSRLDVRWKNVQPELREAVLTGKFLNRSIEHYHDYNGHGPTLVAVAFLGGNAPAVDGMEDCEKHFEAADGRLMMSRAGRNIVMFNAGDLPEEERWDDGAFGDPEATGGDGGPSQEEEGDVALTEAQKKELAGDIIAAFKESEEFKSLQAKANQVDQLTTDAEEARQTALTVAAKAFVEGLRSKKKLTPALEQKGLETFLVELKRIGGASPVKFGSEEKTLSAWFEDFVREALDASKLFETVVPEEPEDAPSTKANDGGPTEADAADITKPLVFSFARKG